MKTLIGIILLLIPISLVTSAQNSAAPGFYDDDVPLIAYTGSWTTIADAGAYGGQLAESSAVTDTFTVDVYSQGVTLYFQHHASGAVALICIDGVCSEYDTSQFAGSVNSVSFSSLERAHHTLDVSISSASGTLRFDAMNVHPVEDPLVVEVTAEVQPPAEDWRTVSSYDDDEGVTQSSVFEYRMDAGQVAQVSLQVATVILLGALFIVTVWKAL